MGAERVPSRRNHVCKDQGAKETPRTWGAWGEVVDAAGTGDPAKVSCFFLISPLTPVACACRCGKLLGTSHTEQEDRED